MTLWNPLAEDPADEVDVVTAYFTLISDLLNPERDLHIVDREQFAIVMGDLIRRQGAALARARQ